MEQFRELERAAREAGKGLWGQDTTAVGEPDPDALITVYVTKTGKKYHLDGCKYLTKTKIASTLADARTRYTACKVCLPPK
jgi:hypothetical protein